MSIEQHPLSNGKLGGELLCHKTYDVNEYRVPKEPADWRTLFSYPLGDVELRSTNNGSTYIYKTTIFSEVDKKIDS